MKINKWIIIEIVIIILAIVGDFGVKIYLDKDLEKQKQDLQKTIEKYGYVEEEKAAVSVAKFNTEVMDNKIGNPASDDYMAVQDNLYWYALLNDEAYLYVKPKAFTGNKDNDITATMAIYYSKNIEDETIVIKYVKALIKANNQDLTDSDIDYLITEAKKLSNDKKTANNGKGIFVGYVDNGEKIEYQVTRAYK